ncbi:MAG TPA: 50S ribosomal protein L23 [Candidatus Omnitrophota bacterium]|nr:50S ribosomal protein L23 [Candidatus Omnitrophota bacterium]HQL41579.1 50S ribosomal protein L23 [Candidatus Omnitrophota bacterium]
MANSYDKVKTLIRTEKGTALEEDRKYLFEVDRRATKVEIRKAVEEIYKVKVHSVHTCIVPGKKKRVRQILGRVPDWKKAIVTLHEGHKIEVT